MNKSESIAALAAALAKAQSEMESAPFDRANPFFNSRYATLASVMAALKPIHNHTKSCDAVTTWQIACCGHFP
jgi:hypothetical protein